MPERTTVRLPPDLLRRAKRKAAADGRTLTALIEDGLRLALTENRKQPALKRVLPPISSATGGLMPGLEIWNASVQQEWDDLDYVARMKRVG